MDCMPTQIRKAIEKVIEEKIKPSLAGHGGDIELVSVKNGVATVKLKGACMGCPMAQMTLRYGVEQEIKAAVPQIKRVEAVTF
jgi:Fe-S cluster biogenesis protein NfuA